MSNGVGVITELMYI